MSENKVDAIITSINKLSVKEKRELTIKVRTTPEGIKAYTSFLYGIGGVSEPPKEDPKCEEAESENPKGENDSSSESSTNTSEEWL